MTDKCKKKKLKYKTQAFKNIKSDSRKKISIKKTRNI